MADFVAFGNALPGLIKTVSGNMSWEDTARFLMAQQYKIQDIRITERKNGSTAAGSSSGQAGGQKATANSQKPAVSSAMARLMAMTKGK